MFSVADCTGFAATSTTTVKTQLKSMYYFGDKTFSDNILSREVRCAGHNLRTELAIIVREIFLNVTVSYKFLNL